jgi:FkbM family methyltransferase
LKFVARQGTESDSSKSQLLQDYFALYCNQVSASGFFVEFGACNGVEGSNTFLLERDFNWNGLLAEPGREWHQDLQTNRNCSVDYRCVYSVSGKSIDFVECGQLSTIESFAIENDDWAKDLRIASNNRYSVPTVTLNELLDSHHAPHKINYMSIDTEGSEYECLLGFDFCKYQVNCMTIEHNYQVSRQKVQQLLNDNGFIHVLTDISDYDDWFVNSLTMGL